MTDINREEIYQLAVEMMNDGNNTENVLLKTAEAFETLGDYKDSKELALKCIEKADEAAKNSVYKAGLEKMQGNDISDYEEAIELFFKISEWNDATDKIAECKRKIEEIKDKAEAERLEKERIAKRNKKIAIITTSIVCAIIAFIIVLNTVIIPNSKYNDAIALMDAGNIVEAYEALVALDGYKDSADKANSIYDKYKLEKVKTAKVGDYVSFGAYEQDNNTSNGKEDVKWLVLEIKDGKALVISQYALDCKQYNTNDTDVTWETCTLRRWLNNDFINAAFSADEKAMIPTVIVSADESPHYSTNPGNATQDQVFLLSITEVDKYFSSRWERECKTTAFAAANGEFEDAYWWLRSPGEDQNDAAYVSSIGSVNDWPVNNPHDMIAVRPALWINLSE